LNLAILLPKTGSGEQPVAVAESNRTGSGEQPVAVTESNRTGSGERPELPNNYQITAKEEEGPPSPADVLVSIPCKGTPDTWPLTPDARDRLEALHPGASAVNEARSMKKKIEDGTWTPDTFRKTPQRLAAFMVKAVERGEHPKRPRPAPGPPADDEKWMIDGSYRIADHDHFGGGAGGPPEFDS
jgi:hypothetical protein